jgi:hypothetical protein
MSDLVTCADYAYPFPPSDLPAGVRVVLGYAGSAEGTPHVWTRAEVDAVLATGRRWCPIWTPAPGPFTAQLGLQAANRMLAKLPDYAYDPTGPVFLDIERGQWDAAPATTREGVAAWQETMHKAGHAQAVPYLPTSAGFGWVADWTGIEPATLPGAWTGQQYAGNVDGGRYDLSVMRPEVFGVAATPTQGASMTLDAADLAHIKATVAEVVRAESVYALPRAVALALTGHANALFDAANAGSLADGKGILGRLPASLDPAVFAAEVVAQIGPDFAAHVVTALGVKLAAP